MPRGGNREGAGRKPDPNSKRQQMLAKRAAKKAEGGGYTLANGDKSPDAPPGWPFGKQAPVEPVEPAPPVDPDQDDGLTDEQRAGLSPLDYLLAVMRSPQASKSARMTAAIQAAPFMHAKPAPQGKKEAAADRAKKAGGNKFASAAPPRLAAAGGKRV